MKIKIKEGIKRYFYETFRPRSKEDYAEVLSRGNGGRGKTPYPWFYSRVFLVCFLLFSLICLGYSFSDINFIAVAFAGGIFADLTFIVLLYELYPQRTLSLLAPVAALFAGGLLSSSFAYVLYGIFSVKAAYASQAWTAFVEESGKVLATLVIVRFLKKRDTYAYLLIGAAVGGGFSAFENMWYMYTQGFVTSYYGLSPAMSNALFRALGTPFSHAAWAAAFGWALSDKKPWRKPKIYLVLAFDFAMHFFVNFPLIPAFGGWKGYPISAATGIMSVAFLIYIVVISRREFLPYGQLSMFAPSKAEKSKGDFEGNFVGNFVGYISCVPVLSSAGKKKLALNVLAACSVILFSCMLFGPTCVYGGYENYNYVDCQTFEDAKAIAENGMDFSPDFERKYKGDQKDRSDLFGNYFNYQFTWSPPDGEISSVTQRENYGGYFYRFRYAYSRYTIFKDGQNNLYVRVNGEDVYILKDNIKNGEFEIIYAPDSGAPRYARRWELQSITLEYEDGMYGCQSFYVLDTEADPAESAALKKLNYFIVNEKCVALYTVKTGGYRVMMEEVVSVRRTESIVFTSVFGAAFIGCGLSYIILKSKIRRNKNAE